MFRETLASFWTAPASHKGDGPDEPTIDFICDPADLGVITEPVPAKLSMPDWFKRLPAVDDAAVSATNNGLTVKRCMPFLDAMMLGFVLPLAATTRLEVRENGKTVEAGWEFDKVMVSNHGSHQVAGHPLSARPPMKFHNYWTIRTPPGWSCLFVAPLNREPLPVAIIAGVVDTDAYHSLINFPFFATGADGVHVLEKGTPLVQVIPFRRADAALKPALNRDAQAALSPSVRAETPQESQARETIRRNTIAGEGWYRKFARARR